jgi:hypothetical protein
MIIAYHIQIAVTKMSMVLIVLVLDELASYGQIHINPGSELPYWQKDC